MALAGGCEILAVMNAGRMVSLAVVMMLVAGACGSSDSANRGPATTTVPAAATSAAPAATTTTTSEPIDPAQVLRLNDIQVLGSHNSYHQQPDQLLFDAIGAMSPELAESIEYSHRSLAEQLGEFGIRQLEIDVFADPDGGLWSSRQALPVIGQPAESGLPELDEPGFKVLHTQDFDFATTCFTLVSCLTEVKDWSMSNPYHLPILILIEFKDESVADAAAREGIDLSTVPIPFTEPVVTTPEILDSLDSEILSVISRVRLITPDDLRGDHATLDEAVLTDGWPLLADSRGKIMFALDNGGEIRDLYRAPSDVLAGRVMFTSSEPGSPDGAFVKINEPIGNVERINQIVASGYLVRTRTDVPTSDARSGSTERRDAALSTGAQFLSTDYYVENPDFGTGYVVEVESRCNPITEAGINVCTAAALDHDLG